MYSHLIGQVSCHHKGQVLKPKASVFDSKAYFPADWNFLRSEAKKFETILVQKVRAKTRRFNLFDS